MRIRYFIDPESELPHIYKHDVGEREVEEILERPGEDRAGANDSRIALGQTREGRCLRVIYTYDDERDEIFVITAYELRGKPLTTYRRRLRQRRQP